MGLCWNRVGYRLGTFTHGLRPGPAPVLQARPEFGPPHEQALVAGVPDLSVPSEVTPHPLPPCGHTGVLAR